MTVLISAIDESVCTINECRIGISTSPVILTLLTRSKSSVSPTLPAKLFSIGTTAYSGLPDPPSNEENKLSKSFLYFSKTSPRKQCSSFFESHIDSKLGVRSFIFDGEALKIYQK